MRNYRVQGPCNRQKHNQNTRHYAFHLVPPSLFSMPPHIVILSLAPNEEGLDICLITPITPIDLSLYIHANLVITATPDSELYFLKLQNYPDICLIPKLLTLQILSEMN